MHAGGFRASSMNGMSSKQLSKIGGLKCTEPDTPQPDFQPISSDDEVEVSEMSFDDSDNQDVPESSRRAQDRHPSSARQRQERMADSPIPPSAVSPRSSWTDLDLSVVVALVAPVGNWLTGSDHLKNLFLILLLIVYLHQLIQVPWELYQSACARRAHPNIPMYRASSSGDALRAKQELAASELRRHELAYLFLSVVSPFLGALLLRFVLDTLSSIQNISWFSTTLFVLATGIRPWAHLISRLRNRTQVLHDIIHYPSPDMQLIADSKLQVVVTRMEKLENELASLKRNMVEEKRVEEMYDDLSGAIDDVERVLKKQESKSETTRVAHEHRIAAVEKGVSKVKERKRADNPRLVLGGIHGNTYVDSKSHSFITHFSLALAQAIHVLWALFTFNFRYEPTSPNNRSKYLSSPDGTKLHHMKSPHRLETIHEDAHEVGNGHKEEESESSSELADTESPTVIHKVSDEISLRKRRSRPSYSFFDFVADLVTLPYRFAIQTLLAISPPIQRLFT
ncbi:hypothetical protein EVG20_g3461 [Dentipellis fragilis]|uniref:Uncharacterized protein n=1 Tax=Dentipellis fragilis TaxID=205917 RepID=A0A4Y9Z464_9AGAM|nr:hypothetical protein EVG20_g3461 [Dentipellis fragilis]